MLLFKPEHVQLILDGIKTQTRRNWKKKRCNVGAIHKAKTKMLSKKYFAKLKILRVWEEHLGEITEEDSKAEGYKNREEYLKAYLEINKIEGPDQVDALNSYVWCVEFRKTPDFGCQLCPWDNVCTGKSCAYTDGL